MNRSNQINDGGAICGGVISMSQQKKDMKKYGMWANAMSFVMPDKQYKRYIKYLHAGNKKMSNKIFDRYAMSQI